ncbi:PREDICTED: ABC transporter G family member 31 isoform X2 [Populus euphratica]|nr:PREDICTED: ABC transporter G family member 31 isoform X2 [Populus euphratica]
MEDLVRLEKERNVRPNLEVDAFMKASSVGGKKHSISTDYVLKVLGLDICSETVVGNDMLRGVSGGQRKRVTTGEMIVGPRKTLFMDEISTGLDSSTTYQIVKCVGNFVHLMEATVLMALLQPAPETFDLFDDLVLLSEGYVVYQGPRAEVLEFFESLGFKLPPRKGVADFLQEVTSKKDQAQYWADQSKPYVFLPSSEIAKAFKNSKYGKYVDSELSVPFDKSKSHVSALSKTKYAVSRWELFKTCFSREVLLISRHRFLYIFRTCQVAFVGFVTCTLFLRTRLHPTDEMNGNLYLSCLFFGLVHMMFNGFSELSLLIFRLPVFYKQRDNLFHPAWVWSVASFILRLPYSIVEAVVWSCVVYYTVGFAPGAGRFFRFMLLLFSIHQMALGLFRTMGSIARDLVVANTFGSAALLAIFLLGGFIIPKAMIKPWWIWGYWLSPLTYGQRAISVNEFGAERWIEKSSFGNNTVGNNILYQHSLPSSDYWYWIGVGVLLLYTLLFNIIVTWALTYLNPLTKGRTVAPADVTQENSDGNDARAQEFELNRSSLNEGSKNKGMILPFQPLTMTFHNVNYFVDMPKEMSKQGITEKKLQLLSNVSGVFSPGVLTALVGSSGAGKTTLMDVLAGRKTGGYIEGDIKISGYPKEQRTFARISGYVEQNDIHSPQLTIEESLLFSSSLRLPKEVSQEQRVEFVEEVMRLVELDTLRQALVGLPGSSGLSTEQRKRLTIAVELVANPSIIFMDEPTSGLDARAAAIVMRTVRNTVDTGRTVVCTIHQPSIDIFEAFDELLLMKRGGRVIYGGKLGVHSKIMIDFFQGIKGVPPCPDGYNPATWMLEVTTPTVEERVGEDFAELYRKSSQYREVEASIMHLSSPPAGSEPLKFESTYARDALSQFYICLWKQNLVYWRSPQYNGVRLCFTVIAALILGSVFWNIGSKRDSTQALSVVMGALYSSCMFLGVNNASSVQPVVSIERTVFYREKAAGMYSPLSYAVAQGLVEIPYILVQTILYGIITYFMVDFERTAGKFFLFLVFMFLTFTYFTFYGMMAVGLTPSQHLAAVISSAFYSLWNLLSGFLVPQPSIPGWWIWFYYICPIAWTLRGVICSQLGDVETIIVGPGFEGTVKKYLEVTFGYGPNMIGASIAALVGFCLLFFIVFALSVKFLNFQKR